MTSLQPLQMVGGIVVTTASAAYHLRGATCYVSLANSLLGCLMYASYFLLFAKLFRQHYILKKAAIDQTSHARPGEGPRAVSGNLPGRGRAALAPSDFEAWPGKGEVILSAYVAAEMVAKARAV